MAVFKIFKEKYNSSANVWVVEGESVRYVDCSLDEVEKVIKNLNREYHYNSTKEIIKSVPSVEDHLEFLSKKVKIILGMNRDDIITMGINVNGIVSEYKNTIRRLENFEQDYVEHKKLTGPLYKERFSFNEIYLNNVLELSGGTVIVPKQEKD